ncbi:Maf-like protein [gamma proteobacterium HdN1]|nr:Maf-like protein [gamma proteobacterium HdN1]
MTQIVLGSSSPFRKQLLEKLGVPFVCCSPEVDETPFENEAPEALVRRLALLKAEAVANLYPQALIIASDQVSVLNGQINGKPGNREAAIRQLEASSGQTVVFYTSLCVYDALTQRYELGVEPFSVHFRTLNRDQIARYVDHDSPLNCAGSFKSEGFGITLFKSFEGKDPNTLIGLPLILLVEMLERFNLSLP